MIAKGYQREFSGGRHAPTARPEPRNPFIIGQKYGEVLNQISAV